ncbi:hypothetical protein BGZ81_010106 [Podila clonocystis]|nr:hypothetical protein BGZ81_010106 [Podila clonocystis]
MTSHNACESPDTGATCSLRTCGGIYPLNPLLASPSITRLRTRYSPIPTSVWDPNPTWTDAEQWSILALIKRNRGLRSIELTIRHPADPIRIGEVLRELPCLEKLELDGPDFEQEGVFWNLIKTSPVLRSATFRNWSQNRLTVDRKHQPQDKKNIINVRRLFLSGCGSVLSLAHSFPVLEALDISRISDQNAEDLATLLANGHAPKL